MSEVFKNFIYWSCIGSIIMGEVDSRHDFELTKGLKKKWPKWLPSVTPCVVVSVFWPLALIWVALRKK